MAHHQKAFLGGMACSTESVTDAMQRHNFRSMGCCLAPKSEALGNTKCPVYIQSVAEDELSGMCAAARSQQLQGKGMYDMFGQSLQVHVKVLRRQQHLYVHTCEC